MSAKDDVYFALLTARRAVANLKGYSNCAKYPMDAYDEGVIMADTVERGIIALEKLHEDKPRRVSASYGDTYTPPTECTCFLSAPCSYCVDENRKYLIK